MKATVLHSPGTRLTSAESAGALAAAPMGGAR
jgi:hypothetical protein